MVWPSVFEVDHILNPPPYTGFIGPLWDHLGSLIKFLDEHWKHSMWDASYTIAVSVVLDEVQLHSWPENIGALVTPNKRSKAWKFLGYDISDRWLLSGLTNSANVSQSDFGSLRAAWADHLNDRHLFDDLGLASRFCAESTIRASEHAPFFVFGLWSVAEGRRPPNRMLPASAEQTVVPSGQCQLRRDPKTPEHADRRC